MQISLRPKGEASVATKIKSDCEQGEKRAERQSYNLKSKILKFEVSFSILRFEI